MKCCTEIAAKVNPGSDGLLFHPYLAGERAPFYGMQMRGDLSWAWTTSGLGVFYTCCFRGNHLWSRYVMLLRRLVRSYC